MEDFIKKFSENYYGLLAIVITGFMFILSGLLRFIAYIVDKLTKEEENE